MAQGGAFRQNLLGLADEHERLVQSLREELALELEKQVEQVSQKFAAGEEALRRQRASLQEKVHRLEEAVVRETSRSERLAQENQQIRSKLASIKEEASLLSLPDVAMSISQVQPKDPAMPLVEMKKAAGLVGSKAEADESDLQESSEDSVTEMEGPSPNAETRSKKPKKQPKNGSASLLEASKLDANGKRRKLSPEPKKGGKHSGDELSEPGSDPGQGQKPGPDADKPSPSEESAGTAEAEGTAEGEADVGAVAVEGEKVPSPAGPVAEARRESGEAVKDEGKSSVSKKGAASELRNDGSASGKSSSGEGEESSGESAGDAETKEAGSSASSSSESSSSSSGAERRGGPRSGKAKRGGGERMGGSRAARDRPRSSGKARSKDRDRAKAAALARDHERSKRKEKEASRGRLGARGGYEHRASAAKGSRGGKRVRSGRRERRSRSRSRSRSRGGHGAESRSSRSRSRNRCRSRSRSGVPRRAAKPGSGNHSQDLDIFIKKNELEARVVSALRSLSEADQKHIMGTDGGKNSKSYILIGKVKSTNAVVMARIRKLEKEKH